MLGSVQLGARLGVQLEARLGIGWEIGIRFGLAQGSAGLTCLGLVLGIGSGLGSAWKPGQGSRFDQHPFASPMLFSKFHPCGEHALFSPNILHFSKIFFFKARSI